MKSLRKNTRSSFEIVVDTNIIFSAILYPNGNERKLFNNAEKVIVPIVILDFVEDELKAIFLRKGLTYDIVVDFFDTYHNVTFKEIGEVTDDEASIAKELVSDLKDRPLFVFVYRCVQKGTNCYLITGDNDLHKTMVKNALKGRVYFTKEFIKHRLR